MKVPLSSLSLQCISLPGGLLWQQHHFPPGQRETLHPVWPQPVHMGNPFFSIPGGKFPWQSPCTPSLRRYGKAVLITAAAIPEATRELCKCKRASELVTSTASYSLSLVYQLSPLWCHPPVIPCSPFSLATTPRQTVLRKN